MKRYMTLQNMPMVLVILMILGAWASILSVLIASFF